MLCVYCFRSLDRLVSSWKLEKLVLEIYGVSLLWLLKIGLDDISNTCFVIFTVSLSTPLRKQ